ncbi:MAG: LytR C-terminal domain-containing protein [Gaiellales bacterium]
MELPAPAFPSLGEPRSGWRRVALIAGAIAAVELVVLLVIGLAFAAKPFAGDAKDDRPAAAAVEAVDGAGKKAGEAAKPTMPATGPTQAGLPRAKTPVLVLNGNGISGAAATRAAAVRRLQYPVVRVGDAQRRSFPHTIVMYRPGFLGEGQRLAKDLGLARSRAVPLDGMRGSALHGAKLVLVVGNAA